MSASPKPATRVEHVFCQLREEILRGVRKPGSAIKTAELATGFGVSLSVAREALSRLAGQNLVVSIPNQGFHVIEVSREDLDDLIDTRVDIEGIALRRSIERGDLTWEALVISTHHVLEGTQMFMNSDIAAGSTMAWVQAHHDFHSALISACGSPRLLTFAGQLRDSAEIYRLLSRHAQDEFRDVAGEHRELMELTTQRQTNAAVHAMEKHLRTTQQFVCESAFNR